MLALLEAGVVATTPDETGTTAAEVATDDVAEILKEEKKTDAAPSPSPPRARAPSARMAASDDATAGRFTDVSLEKLRSELELEMTSAGKTWARRMTESQEASDRKAQVLRQELEDTRRQALSDAMDVREEELVAGEAATAASEELRAEIQASAQERRDEVTAAAQLSAARQDQPVL